MKYNIRGEKIEVTDSIKDYLITKISKLERYFDGSESIEVKVLLIVRGREHKIEVTIPYKTFTLRAESSHIDMYAAIDLVIDKLERQVRKHKTKIVSKQRREEIANEIEDYFEETSEEIVKRKELFLKPIDEEEATLQMELLGHDFYIFKNLDQDNKVCIIYKRKDGGYGIIKAN